MCAITATAIYLCLLMPSLASGIFASSPEYHHSHPAELNEVALRRLANGSDGTALIMLERAAVLAPQEATIVNNRDAIRIYRVAPGDVAVGGLDHGASSAGASAPAAGNLASPLPPLPALWPAK
jgi:hypothetical protein